MWDLLEWKTSIEANNLLALKHYDEEKAVAFRCDFYLIKEPEQNFPQMKITTCMERMIASHD